MTMSFRLLLAALPAIAMLAHAGEAAQRVERLKVGAGIAAATINGRIKGDDGVSYVVDAAEGQTLSVAFSPENPQCHFNVVEPGSEQKTLHDGTQAGNSFEGTLPVSGDYLTQVYLMQDAAQREEICDYSIKIEVTG